MADNPIIIQHRALSEAAQRVTNAQRALTRSANALKAMTAVYDLAPDDVNIAKQRIDHASDQLDIALAEYAKIGDVSSTYYTTKVQYLREKKVEAEVLYREIFSDLVGDFPPYGGSAPAEPPSTAGRRFSFDISDQARPEHEAASGNDTIVEHNDDAGGNDTSEGSYVLADSADSGDDTSTDTSHYTAHSTAESGSSQHVYTLADDPWEC